MDTPLDPPTLRRSVARASPAPDRETDFVAWADAQAVELRRLRDAGVPTTLDLDGLADEVGEMGDVKRDELEGNLARIIEHLLKLEHSPAADPRRKWRLSVVEHRVRARRMIDRSGTLRREVSSYVAGAWGTGRTIAIKALTIHGEDPSAIPTDCPFTLDQILDDAFEPPSRHGLD